MPQPQKYNSHAERQAAYRKRRQETLAEHLESKGLPPLVAGKTKIAGQPRWHGMEPWQ